MPSTSAKPYTQEPICLDGRGIHSSTISCLDFLDEDRRIITCSEDGSIQVRKVDTGQVVGGPWSDAGSGAVHAMAVSPNRREVVTGSQDGRIRLWTVTGEMAGKWKQVHSLTILSVCWSPDELHIASGSEDGTAIIWDARKGDIVGRPIRTGHSHVYAVCYSSDGATLITSGYNNKITFWDVKTREVLHFVEACHASQQVHCVTWTSYDRIFLGCSNGITQARTDTQGIVHLGERTSPICAIVLSQDENSLATASLDNTIRLWDPKTNQSVGQPLHHPNGLRCAAFARNSRLLATSGIDKNVYIWDLQAPFGRDVNVADSESGPSLGTSTAGHSLIDINASICPAGNNTRKGSRHSDTNVPDGPPGPFDVATGIRSVSPPNSRPWDARSTAQSGTSFVSVGQVAAARTRETSSRPGSFSRTRPVEAGHVTRGNSSHVHQSPLPGHQEDAVHQPVRVKDNVWFRFWLRVGCLSSTGIDD